jgi:hypothetical protein
LTGAIRAQADKLLQTILSSSTIPATLRVIDRAEWFIPGLEIGGGAERTGASKLVRSCMVTKIDGGPHWSLSIRLGGSGTRWVPVRSRRERLRTWASLIAVGRFAEGVGLSEFSVEL